ncbi:MAG TPA: hypothetical protein V6D04_10655, partial [Candidatus Obscuribacterales bacterium]
MVLIAATLVVRHSCDRISLCQQNSALNQELFVFPVRFSIQPLALLLLLGFSFGSLSACSSDSSSNTTNLSTLSAAPTGTANAPNATATNQVENNVVRIGYQKYGTLFLLKARGDLDKRLQEQGVSVQWVQFPAGPPLLEALNAGSIDYGSTGETPPIFAQAAGTPLIYVAHEPP